MYVKIGKLPSRECAEVVLATLGLALQWVKATELASYPPFPRCYTHSLVLAHNIFLMYFQSGERIREKEKCYLWLSLIFNLV